MHKNVDANFAEWRNCFVLNHGRYQTVFFSNISLQSLFNLHVENLNSLKNSSGWFKLQ